MSEECRVAVNGFGRIGRVLARQVVARTGFRLVAVNDLTGDVGNLAYLFNYDTNYGRAPVPATEGSADGTMVLDGSIVRCHGERLATDVPWEDSDVDVLVDATGVAANVLAAHELVAQGRVPKVVITHCPSAEVDLHLIYGINDDRYLADRHHVVAGNICDANAVAHPIKALQESFEIASGYLTTIHPWLSYQHLVDAPTVKVSEPQHFWPDYSLGRASSSALIPKNTTAVDALAPVLPDVAAKLGSFSYRVPTPVVASADLTLRLGGSPGMVEVEEVLRELVVRSSVVNGNDESLVSQDYLGVDASATIDFQWLGVHGDLVKVVLWYDNEWGYAARMLDIAGLMGGIR